MRFDVFGRELIVERREDRWIVFYLGEGKRRKARDIAIPPTIPEGEIEAYLADLLHELARPGQETVRCLD